MVATTGGGGGFSGLLLCEVVTDLDWERPVLHSFTA